MEADKKTIMFVEDNHLVLSIYRGWLQRYGFKVEGASDGEFAVQKLPLLRPDVVILDYMLPKVSGLEVLKFIRSHPKLAKTPVLVLSNAFVEDQVLKELSAGVNRQLHKTQCTPKLLVQTIRELVGLLPPPDWRAAAFPPPGTPEALNGRQPGNAVDARKFQKDLVRIREASLGLRKEAGTPAGADHLNILNQHVQCLGTRAALEGCAGIAQVASALEALLLETTLNKSPLTPSGLQTVTQTVDCLGSLIEGGNLAAPVVDSAAKVLVVEDNPICSLAAMAAMKRAKLEATSTADASAALELARTTHFDTFLVDIKLPGMNGFELCKQLRLLPQYRKTPVIFVTADNEFQNRTQAVLSGGNDLIAKPIWPQELALKTIMRLAESLPRPAETRPAQTPARSAAAPAASKATDKTVTPRNGSLTLAKPGQPVTPASRPPAPAPAGRNGVNHRDDDNLFDKTTRDVARIESSPAKRTGPAASGAAREIPAASGEADTPLDALSRKIARILFGEEFVTETSLHLTRIALEHRRVPEILQLGLDGDADGPGAPLGEDFEERFDQITREVARTVFEDEDVSETHLRLTRIVLERCRLPDVVHPGQPLEDWEKIVRGWPRPAAAPRRRETGTGRPNAAGGARRNGEDKNGFHGKRLGLVRT